MYTAAVERELSFHMLHEKDLSPIRFARICRADGKEIPQDHIVKGYEYRDGDYVILHDEDFKKADVHKTKSIDIVEFSEAASIDPIYFEKPYYLEPAPGAGKAYVILREALIKSGKVGVAKYVLRNKEHVGILKAEGNALILDQMRYKDEMTKPKLTIPAGHPAKNEIAMAIKLIDQFSGAFHPEKFHDAYSKDLEKVIEKKAHGKPVHVKGVEPVPTKAPDIMAMLKASLEKEHAKAR
jgi:DNA end-binding protein Ku